MARVVAAIPERSDFARSEKYPYEEWFDGQVWELTVGGGEDPDIEAVSPSAAATLVRNALARRGIENIIVAQRGEKLYIGPKH